MERSDFDSHPMSLGEDTELIARQEAGGDEPQGEPAKQKPKFWQQGLQYLKPDMDRDTIILYTASMAFLVLYLHHGKSSHFYSYFSWVAKAFDYQMSSLLSYVYSHVAALVILGILPFMVGRYVLKMTAEDMGLKFKSCRTEMIIVGLCLLFMLPLVYIFSHTSDFAAQYPKLKVIRESWSLFGLYQAAYLIKWLSWEFFFRGFLLFGLARRYGSNAILLSSMPFVIAHLGKPEAEVFGAIIAGFILGKLSYSGKSIYPTVLLHFGVAFMMDFFTSI